MSRFSQRAKRRLQDVDIKAGYDEMDAQIRLVEALDRARQTRGVTQQQLAETLGCSQPAVSQFFSADQGMTIERFVEYLMALQLQARIEIVPASPNDPPVIVANRIAAT